MADNFGLKIGIEGEKGFKNTLRDINQSFKVLGSEMNLVSSQFDKQDKSIEAITARNKVLNKEIDTQKEKISTLEKALQNAATSFGENDKRTQSWQIQLNNAKAALNGMEKELDQNNKALDTAGKEFNDTEKQADEFGKEVKKSADKADDAGNRFEKLGGVLKGVGEAMAASMAAIGTAAVSAAKALTDMTVGAAAYADEILTMSTVTGMSTERLQAYQYAAELVDVSMETLTGTMAKQIKSMSEARDGSARYAEAYEKLGISVTDSNGQLRDGETVYWETIDALGKVANETERDAIAMQIFGRSARDLNPLIAQGSSGIAALTEEAKRMGAVMSEDAINQLGAFDDSVQRLKSGTNAAKNALGMVLLPQLQTLADDGVSLIGDFTRGLNEAGGDWNKISEVVGDTVAGLTNMLMDNLPKFIQIGLDMITSIGGAIIDNLPTIIDAAITIVMTLLQAMLDALPQITQGALQLVLALVKGLIDNLPAIVEGAILLVVTLAKGIGEALPELIPAIIDAVLLIVETIIENMGLILEAAFSIIEGLAEGLLEALPRLMDALPEIIESIIDFITDNLPEIVEMGIKLTVQLAIGLIKAIPQLVEKLPQIVTAIINGIGQAVTSIVDIGKNIIRGLWDGIVSMGDWLREKFNSFIDGIVGGVQDLLGIHSPSTVFAGIGSNMGQGIGVGFLEAMNGVEKDMKKAIPKDFDMNASLKLDAAGSASRSVIEHTGVIEVRGINNKNELAGVVDIVMDQFRREARLKW